MSWQQYVDEQLIATKVVKDAVIAGHDGNIWAASKDFSVTAEEMKKIAENFSNQEVMAMNGLVVAGTKYMYLSSNERIIRAKKGTGGIHLMKTVQALIMSSYADPVTPEQCAVVTEKLGDYLIEKGF